MSNPALWKSWEGRVADGKFPLRQWLGGSDRGAVFLTELAGKDPQRAAIKLIPVETSGANDSDAAAQLSCWAASARLLDPHLIRILGYGRCEIDDTKLLYVVTEYAEENLAEIVPLRPLAAAEATDMLRPAAEALAYVHESGFVHGRIKPANIMAAADKLKISSDPLCKPGERGIGRATSLYDAPEIARTGPTAPGDIWSLGMTLVAVMTQSEPKGNSGAQNSIAIPNTIPHPLREIAQLCLKIDPKQRCSADEILAQMQPPAAVKTAVSDVPSVGEQKPKENSKRWILIPTIAAALLFLVLIGFKFLGHQPAVPVADNRPANPPADVPAAQQSAPFSQNKRPASEGVMKGRVLQQVLPEVSRSAQNTITGRLKVSVQVSVDASGNVSQAKLVLPGPSRYFASHALEAARRWKFDPPQVDGEAAASEWLLRFQFGRGSIQVVPTETRP